MQHADGSRKTLTCDWLIAADGIHSIIRKSLNLAFDGAVISEKFIMTDATISADFNPNYLQTGNNKIKAGQRVIDVDLHDAA